MERENKRAGEKLEARDRESNALLRQMSGRWCAHSVPGSQERHVTGRSMDAQTQGKTPNIPPTSGRRQAGAQAGAAWSHNHTLHRLTLWAPCGRL